MGTCAWYYVSSCKTCVVVASIKANLYMLLLGKGKVPMYQEGLND